jgi:pimeloyl-ACP methyl ester carboxylesterase
MGPDARVVPFTAAVPASDLDDLRLRVRRTRWPDRETVDDWSQGVPLSYMQELCGYWCDHHDWRAVERRLNGFAQFTTDVDGLTLHFVHVRSPHPGAIPLVITHGWPGSVLEFLKIIEPLADPPSAGGDARDAFHVVCPSLPGFGFSGKPGRPGWGPPKVADAWVTLMQRLGYQRFGAQGGDWGASVTTELAVRHADALVGVHLNFVRTEEFARKGGGTSPDELSADEHEALAARVPYERFDLGYRTQQGTRPQTLAYGLADSPAGQCAWILEKFFSWTDSLEQPEEAISRDEILDGITLYWLTNTAGSSARMYWEAYGTAAVEPIGVPSGATIFPKENYRPPRSWVERRLLDLRHFNRPARGGHFAALEQPDVLVGDIRATFAGLRS